MHAGPCGVSCDVVVGVAIVGGCRGVGRGSCVVEVGVVVVGWIVVNSPQMKLSAKTLNSWSGISSHGTRSSQVISGLYLDGHIYAHLGFGSTEVVYVARFPVMLFSMPPILSSFYPQYNILPHLYPIERVRMPMAVLNP